ncbi:MAG TPA: response regulator transcription factor [Enterococcus sp.]|nr:response regulator transcription factor [Enterococcus sp.]
MKKTIYLIEDDETIVTVVKKHLENWDYHVVSPKNFQAILEEFQILTPDLILLDISLPYFNGFYWCQEIRKFSEVPIIFLSSAEEKMNQIMAMNMGADDFVAKPFDLGVLVAKIQALLRRSYQYGQPVLIYQLGEVTFNPVENQLKSAVDLVTLSPTETRILAALMQKQGEIIPREEIIQALWNSDEFIDNNTLALNMTRLRKKLQSIGIVDVIQTVKNRGYVIEKEFK